MRFEAVDLLCTMESPPKSVEAALAEEGFFSNKEPSGVLRPPVEEGRRLEKRTSNLGDHIWARVTVPGARNHPAPVPTPGDRGPPRLPA